MSDMLGPYELQRRIGAGGMADVFLARGPNGVCVVKRPHAHLCANPEFVRMFLDEAAILAQLHHPNIAQIFDLGAAGGAYYLAMEYVPGFDLMTISLEHERQGELMAPELCARIVADVAGALHFAHEAKDRLGQPLHIIHRDVSPHNILLSTQGVVKLIDFGVARMAMGTHRTQAGLVKGKYPYMSPEQIAGGDIDRRVDVYALGLVLYELLTNVRAIAGNTEIEQIDAAREGRIRPIEQLRPNLTMPLRQILGGCLHPDPSGRYPTALAVADDLEKYLSYERHVVGQEDLLRLFRVVAAEAGHLVPTEPDSDAPKNHPTEPEGPPTPLVLAGPESVGDLSLGYSPTVPSLKQAVVPEDSGHDVGAISLTQQIAKPSSSTKWLAAGVMVVLAAGIFSWTQLRPRSVVVSEPTAVAALVDAGHVQVAALDAGGIEVNVVAPEPAEDAGVVAAPGLEEAPARASVLFVDAEPPGDISVDGQPYGRLSELELMPGKHTIVTSNKVLGFSKRVYVNLKPGDRKPLRLRVSKGTLQIKIEPYGALLVDDEVIAQTTSFKELDRWEGPHVVEASVDYGARGTRKKRVTVEVKPDEVHRIEINLLP